jgi:anti-sigma factor RsiW
MNCEHVEARLSPYLDDVLAPAERLEMTLHMRACTRCSLSLDELRRNDLLLARLPRVIPQCSYPTFEQFLLSSAELPAVAGPLPSLAAPQRSRSWRNRGRLWRSFALRRKARFPGKRAF